MKSKKILITGAGGFIGSNLTQQLVMKNFEVHIFVRNKHSIARLKNIESKINIHFTDMTDLQKLQKLIPKISPEYIFHLATYENYRDETKFTEMVENNIIATKNLLQASLTIPYKCFVNTGSSSEYGLKQKPMKENDLIEPLSFYAVTKASATFLSQMFARKYNKPIITFRLFSVYGPHEAPDRFIPVIFRSLLNNTPFKLTQGRVRRDFIYIDDVVEAYLKTIQTKIKPGQIYNIGTGKQYTNEAVLKIAQKIFNKKINISNEKFPQRSWDTDFWVANVSKAKLDLNWKATNSLKEGLTKTYDWILKMKT